MIDCDKKRLVFAFYINNEVLDNPIIKLHFYFLKKYIKQFDEVIVGIVKDDDVDNDVIKELQHKFLEIYDKDITFRFYPNTQYRETIVFYNEIALKLESLDGMTFFAHNKHTTPLSIEELVEWVCGLYYFNLEIKYDYQATGYCFYGCPLLTNSDFNIKSIVNKYKWYYSGCFYWIKAQEVYRYMQNNKIPLPLFTNRYYGEMFPGELCEDAMIASTHYGRYIKGNSIDVDYVYRNIFYGEHQNVMEDFYQLYLEKLNEVKKC